MYLTPCLLSALYRVIIDTECCIVYFLQMSDVRNRIFTSVTTAMSEVTEDQTDIYWLSTKFYKLQLKHTEILPEMVQIVPYLTSPHHTSPHLTIPRHTSPYLTSPHHNSPHLTRPHFTSPHLTSLPCIWLHFTLPSKLLIQRLNTY